MTTEHDISRLVHARRQAATSTRRQRGIAMLMVLIAVAMATVLALTFVSAQSTTTGISANIDRNTRARYIAESALIIAINEIKRNSDFRSEYSNGTWVTNQSFAGGSFTIIGVDGEDLDGDGAITGSETDGDLADDDSDLVTLTAIGSYDGVVHKVRAVVRPASAASGNLRVLLVVPSTSSLSSQDQARVALMEGWGFTVTLIEAGASQSAIDSAVADADVAYVSEEVVPSAIGTKLKSAAIGVIIEEQVLCDDYGFSSTDGTYSGTAINITNNSHYITSTFSTGSLTILSSSTDLTTATGTLAGGATTLATRTSGSDRALVVIDTGGALYGGGAAAGRRVRMPWGGNSFDITKLNSSGQTLMQRAIEWAASMEGGASDAGLAVNGDLTFKNQSVVDSYDSGLGVYGGANVAADAVITTNTTQSGKVKFEHKAVVNGDIYVGPGGNPSSVISVNSQAVHNGAATTLSTAMAFPPSITVPDFGASSGDLELEDNESITISTNREYNEVKLKNNAKMDITASVTIVIHDELKIEDNAEIRVLNGATLTLYVEGEIVFKNQTKINDNTADPAKLLIYHTSSELKLEDKTLVHAVIVSAGDEIKIKNQSELFGTLLGKSLNLEDTAKFHHDLAQTGSGGGGSGGGAGTTFLVRWDEQP